jgi:HEAT repeat protein
MMESRTHRFVGRNRKKRSIPLSKLRTSEAVRTVVNHPRRIEELVGMVQDRDRVMRSRAATMLARLSESHPGRLLRIIERIKEAIKDDSAYVRWHAVYCIGRVGGKYLAQANVYLPSLAILLDDENRIVRVFAARALGQIALRKPKLVEDYFKECKRELPAVVVRILRDASRKFKKSGKR